jgi:hypothetical protein
MNTLQNIYFTLCKQGYCSDKGSVHSYIDTYERVLSPYRSGSCLEIGLFHGHSLRMWEKYFDGQVHGIDCSLTPHDLADLRPMIATGQHNIHIFDAEDRELVKDRFAGMTFDVIIEDAAHHLPQQVKLYSIFKELLSPGGVYIIEDIQDIEASRNVFENLDDSKDIEIVDLRAVKDRYDDVLVIIKDKANV